jgi:hypothetical protein
MQDFVGFKLYLIHRKKLRIGTDPDMQIKAGIATYSAKMASNIF